MQTVAAVESPPRLPSPRTDFACMHGGFVRHSKRFYHPEPEPDDGLGWRDSNVGTLLTAFSDKRLFLHEAKNQSSRGHPLGDCSHLIQDP